MSNQVVRDCQPDAERLLPLAECMETYGVRSNTRDPHDPQGEWPHNCISTQTVAYSCGLLCRDGDETHHNHAVAELEKCRRLARQAASIMDGIAVGFGSESEDYFRPFLITASQEDQAPQAITADLIRSAFGGTIYPTAEVTVEPLQAEGQWWQQVENKAETQRAWQNLIAWFQNQADLQSAAFISIGSDPLSQYNGGCVFPRLVLALTAAGSLVGICGYVVYT
ncbi:hypothetical protein [Sphaerothrix gracilis]|uniref:hypothetical protein n=1 Tax=Sphaerothrix gracilis TaxID=3151835 RepID=UPI0031FC23DC